MRCPLVFLCIVLLFSSCAQIGMLTGGDADKTPPKVVRYRPDSATTHFNSKTIEITFDEFIQIQELTSQLIISPPLEFNPEITLKKKTLVIELDKKEVLKPNTTYSISFGNAVKDIRESNALENFRYIFSTGPYIDSLTLSGAVEYAFDHKAEKSILVMLYRDMNDSTIYKNLPDYFAKTNDAGFFALTNIRQGKYHIVALKDENSNYKYNDDERFGFISDPVEAGAKDPVVISLYTESPKRIFVKKSTQVQYGKFILAFNRGTDSLDINVLNKEALKGVKELTEYSKARDTITYWIDPVDKDSLILQVKNGASVIDTLNFKLLKRESATKYSRTPFKLTLANVTSAQTFDLNKELQFIFTHPIEKINEGATVIFKEDSVTYSRYPLIFTKSDTRTDAVKIITSQKINAKGSAAKSSRNMLLKENTTYTLTIPPASFTDFYGLTNDTIKMKFRTKEEKFYGSVKLDITTVSTGNYIVQLLDERENVIRESKIATSESIFYDYLYPATYRLKVIFDKNANGKWDEGNYQKKLQPEKVIFNSEPVNIRSNWDLELEWKITEPE